MSKPGEAYRPSSGTEGEYFHEEHCYQCIHERWVHRQSEDRDQDKCPTWTAAVTSEPPSEGYPKEWTYTANGKPTCTKFVKFDWGTDGHAREPEPPPPPEDPRQFMIPFAMSELFAMWGDEVVVTRHAIVEREWLEQMANK